MASGAPPMGELPPGPPLNPLLLTGPDLIGYLFSYALLGALGVQTYIYYLRYPTDSRVLKGYGTFPAYDLGPTKLTRFFAVLAIFLVELLTTGLMTYSAWKTFVSGWGNPMALLEIPWSSAALNPIAGCLFSSVHLFYAWRIYRLGRTYVLPWAVVFFSLGQLGICLYVSTEFAQASSLMDVGGALDNVYIAWLSTSAFCDLLVCGSLLHVLFGAQRQLAMGPTRPLISRVITLTMETTVLTTVAAAVLDADENVGTETLSLSRASMSVLVTTHVDRDYPLGYSNTLLTTLNARNPRNRKLEGGTEVVFWSDMPSSRTRVGATGTSATTSLPAMQFAVPLQERRSEGGHQDTAVDDLSVWKRDEESASGPWEP
ncbi:hypothetical protein GGF50DRAFT_120751 [Schizophyllum commune]